MKIMKKDDNPIIAAINRAAIEAEAASETTQNAVRAIVDEQNELLDKLGDDLSKQDGH